MNLKQTFNIVFHPRNRNGIEKRRYMMISANRLADYIGERNAEILTEKLKEFQGVKAGDKMVKKYPKYGTVYVYGK